MFNNDTWFDPAYARSTFRPITNNALDLGTTALYWSKAYINQVHGASTLGLGIAGTVGYSLAANSILSFTDSNSRIQADTTDGGSNVVGRGAIVFIAGNEYSGYNGLLSLSAGNASSAYVAITAPSATAPTIRFTLTSTEQWRMSSNEITGMNSASNTIARVNDTGYLSIGGGSGAGAPSTGAYLTLRGTSASSAGVAIFSSGTTTNCYCLYAAEGTGGTHRFSISAVEQFRISSTSIIGYDSSANSFIRVNNTGLLTIAGGTSGSSANGAYIDLYGISNASVGLLQLTSGNNASGHIFYRATNASAYHAFYIGGTERLRLSTSGIILYSGTGMGVYRENDTGYSFLAGGTGIAVANSAYILAYGNSHATLPGRMYLYSGSASGLMIFQMGLSTGSFAFKDDVGTNLLAISSAQCYLNVATGGDFSFRVNATQIMSLSASGLRLPSLTDAAAGNDTWYYSTTQSKACYKNSAGTVNVLY
jgi:hypothetical protein